MTLQARALCTLGLVGLFMGSMLGQVLLALLSFTIIVWIAFEWMRFSWCVYYQLPRLAITRKINGSQETTGTLYVGRKVRLELSVDSPRRLSANILARDYVSELVEIQPEPGDSDSPVKTLTAADAKSTSPDDHRPPRPPGRIAVMLKRLTQQMAGESPPQHRTGYPQELLIEYGQSHASKQYLVRTRAAGRFSMPGLRLTIEDRNGFFRVHRFHDAAQTWRIFPAYYEAGELRPTVKRHNTLPRHGIHRLQRSGMGSELLELRDYVSGDPPKSIAWKVSARRDRLLTRQYESEVPVRVHLIIDGSNPTRLGGYGLRPLDQINYVAASVARAALAVGDPVDCTLVDEGGSRRLPWFTGDRGFLELLKTLSDYSLKMPPIEPALSPLLVMMAWGVCSERYPELVEPRINRVPWTFSKLKRRRWRLVGVLGEIYRLSYRQQTECMLDDAALASRIATLLHDAGMPWLTGYMPTPDEPPRLAMRRMRSISQTMLKSIMHAQDNEVFVILADLLSAAPNFGGLENTIKLAVAKHHRVAFICPTTTIERPKLEAVFPQSDSISDLLLAAERTRVRDVSTELKRDLTRLGAAVTFSGEQKAIRLVLSEIDTARSGQLHARGLNR